MVVRPEVIDWHAVRDFNAVGIDIRCCAWCGDGMVRLKTANRPHIFCCAECKREAHMHQQAEWKRNNRPLTPDKMRG